MPPFPTHRLWRVIKTYDHSEGLSCCFRQWQASESHCRFLHGYALRFAFTVACETLDARGWCVDFGGFKPLRAWLHEMFDHTTLAAADDPALPDLRRLDAQGLIRLRVMPGTGCESFARHAHDWASRFVSEATSGRAVVEEVSVSEHGGNSASYRALP